MKTDGNEDEEECPHGAGNQAWCTICNGRDKRDRVAEQKILYSFAAKFNGRCSECHERVEAGEILFARSDGTYACSGCSV